LQDLAQASGSIETAVRDALPNIGTVTIAPRFTAE
jgi:hypothetical protein